MAHRARSLPPAQAKLGDEVLDYRDLAALPRDKAIYNIDRPDMISYSPYISRVAADRQSYGEVGPAGARAPAGRVVTPQRGARHVRPPCSPPPRTPLPSGDPSKEPPALCPDARLPGGDTWRTEDGLGQGRTLLASRDTTGTREHPRSDALG